MHQLTYTKRAEKVLLAMPRDTARQIRDKLRLLAENPYAPNNNATKLQGRAGYRPAGRSGAVARQRDRSHVGRVSGFIA